MSKYQLAIADTESEYVFALTDYTLNHSRESIQVAAFTKTEALLEYLQKNTPTVLLAGADFWEVGRRMAVETTVILLEDGFNRIPAPDEFSVEKYQAADDLLRKVFSEFCPSEDSGDRNTAGRTKITWIYSPSHHPNLFAFAYTYAASLAKQRRTLFLNVCENSAHDWIFQRETREDLAHAFYLLGQKKSFREIARQTVQTVDGVEMIAPMKNVWDLCELSMESWKSFWQQLIGQSDYEELVIVSDGVRGGMDVLLAACTRVFSLVGENEYEQARGQEFSTAIEEKLPSGTHFTEVRLPRMRIPFRGEQVSRQWLYGELGDEVRKYV